MQGYLILEETGKYRGPRHGILFTTKANAEAVIRGKSFGGMVDPSHVIDGRVVKVEISTIDE